MDDIKKKFSLSYQIDTVTPAHVYFRMFSGMIVEEYAHESATRGKCGDLVMRVEEFGEFLRYTQPHLLFFSDGKAQRIDLEAYCHIKLEELFDHVPSTTD